MKAYGVPRVPEAVFPDKADIQRFGFKTCVGSLKARAIQKSAKKRAARRIWKRTARRANRNACKEEGA